MCGIIGYTGNENSVPYLIEGLSALEYRGYDSAGIAVFGENHSLKVMKAKGRLSILADKINTLPEKLVSNCGIGHTRWATHGEPSDINSHPHGTDNLMIVHNGIIENFASLKLKLLEKGYTFVSETDTEVASKLIDFCYQSKNDPFEAVREAVEQLSGSYALGIIFKDKPGKIYAARKDNPLIIAVSETGNFIASDIPAVLKHTRKYCRIDEGEIAIVEKDKVTVYDKDKNIITKPIEEAKWDIEAAEKGGYPHFMIKEINEEPSAIVKTLRPRIKDALPELGIDSLTEEKLKSFERIHIVACGTAMHAGLIGKAAIERLAKIPVNVEIASEYRYNNPIVSNKDLVIIISQSGETADTLAALRLSKEKKAYTLAIVNVAGSSIAREADGVLYTWAGPEIAVASTKAYTVQISIMYLLAIKLALSLGEISSLEAKALTEELLNTCPKAVESAIALADKCKALAEKYNYSSHLFFLGRGMDYALAQEASLKLKEISYIHSEAYAAGELKHGTIALITDNTPVVSLALIDAVFDKMVSNIKECKARGAKSLIICKKGSVIPEGVADDLLEIEQISEIFLPIPAATVCQMFAYYMALSLDCDIDKPRNLAKSVTVE